MQTTVQDLGRPGRAALGVPPGGAADPVALRLGNRLLGNPEGAAGLEMPLIGGLFAFDADAHAVILGGQADIHLDGAPAPSGAVLRVPAGRPLRVGRVAFGARAYLCIRGGLAVPAVLGSASTLLAAGFGGHQGRALRAGDAIPLGTPAGPTLRESLPPAWRAQLESVRDRRTLRAIPDPHAPAGPLWTEAFTVTPRSDRAGLRLSGPALPSPFGGSMPSEGMSVGSLQVPADGRPILLMPDGPTTGGYPVAARIAEVDHPTLGQLPPLATIRFEQVTLDQARELWRQREAMLAREDA